MFDFYTPPGIPFPVAGYSLANKKTEYTFKTDTIPLTFGSGDNTTTWQDGEAAIFSKGIQLTDGEAAAPGSNIFQSVAGVLYFNGAPVGGSSAPVWGSIGGTIANQPEFANYGANGYQPLIQPLYQDDVNGRLNIQGYSFAFGSEGSTNRQDGQVIYDNYAPTGYSEIQVYKNEGTPGYYRIWDSYALPEGSFSGSVDAGKVLIWKADGFTPGYSLAALGSVLNGGLNPTSDLIAWSKTGVATQMITGANSGGFNPTSVTENGVAWWEYNAVAGSQTFNVILRLRTAADQVRFDYDHINAVTRQTLNGYANFAYQVGLGDLSPGYTPSSTDRFIICDAASNKLKYWNGTAYEQITSA